MNEPKKSPVKEKLYSVRKLDLAAEEAMLNYESINSDLLKVTPFYGGVHVKSGSNTADFSGGVDRLREAAERVLLRFDQYAAAKAEVVEIISAMDKWPDEMKCLRLRYLTYRENKNWRLLSWDEVAVRMCVSRRQVTNIHGQALQRFERIWKAKNRDK